MPRILVAGFCGFPAPDRPGVQLRHIVRGLRLDNVVDVLAVRRADQAYVERWSRARILRVPLARGSREVQVDAYRRALRRQLEGADYHVVHVRDGVAGQVALDLAARLRFAVVFDHARAEGAAPPSADRAAAAALAGVEAELAARADLVLVGGEAARRSLAAGDDARIHRVAPGVDVDTFDVDEPRPGAPRVLYAGDLGRHRGVRLLLAAFAELAGRRDVELALVGRLDAARRAELAAAIARHGLADRVVLTGEVPHDELPAVLATATVCVAPVAAASAAALYPTKLLEYMACGRAVVAPRGGAVAELVRDEREGLLFEAGQPTDLAAKLDALLADPARRGAIAEAGYRAVRDRHTASATRRQLRAAYAWLAARPAWRDRLAEPVGDEPLDHGGGTAGGASEDAPLHASSAGPPRARHPSTDGMLVDDDDAGDTGLHDVTKVEAPLLPGDDDGRARASAATLPDDWVVDGPPAGDAGAGVGALLPGERAPRGGRAAAFVAGELDSGGDPGTAAAPPDDEVADVFVAVAPPLGFGETPPGRGPRSS